MSSILNNLVKDFNHVISYSQGIPNVNSKDVFKKWVKNKHKFRKAFGGLIYETDEVIEITHSQEHRKNRINEFLDTVILKYHSLIDLKDFETFVDKNIDNFYSNYTVEDYFYNDIVIQKGTKIIKAFKYFIDNKEFLDDIQNRASMIIQEEKITGKLCLSVHPLDFLSSSENTHGWRSCHSLDGDYRAGNISYMGDGVTFMCYLKSENDAILPNFPHDLPWNNKKWRMLMFLSQERTMLFAGRQYPFELDNILLNKIKQIVIDLGLLRNEHYAWCDENSVSEWVDKKIDFDKDLGYEFGPYIPIGNGRIRKFRSIIKDSPNSCHYNDLLYSSYYTPKYCFNKNIYYNIPDYKDYVCLIGHPTMCLSCGKHLLDPHRTDSEQMVCEYCEDECRPAGVGYCEHCGSWVRDEENYHFIEGELYCETCYPEVGAYCENCNRNYFYNDLHLINKSRFFCTTCMGKKNLYINSTNDELTEDNFDEWISRFWSWQMDSVPTLTIQL